MPFQIKVNIDQLKIKQETIRSIYIKVFNVYHSIAGYYIALALELFHTE
ncbi:hypothetical protein [Mangrovibacterium sp.]